MEISRVGPEQIARIQQLQAGMEQLPQAECPVRNLFAPGVYLREMTIPEGVAAVGAIHKTEHFSILSAGVIAVDDGNGVEILAAPCTFVSKPGAKRAVVAFETTVWTTVHANPANCTDLAALVASLCESSADELLGGTKNVQLLQQEAQKLEKTT